MKFSRIVLAAGIAAALATSAFAGDTVTSTLAKAPKATKTVAKEAFNTPKALKEAESRGQLKVVKQFEGPSGLTGWVVIPGAAPGAKPMIMYSTTDAKTLITGMPVLVDEFGRNLSNEYDNQHLPKPDYSAIWGDLGKAKSINTGKQGANPVYVFFDPNCIFCNYAYRALDAYAKAGADIRYIPVGILREDSLAKAAALLSAKDPAAALAEHEEKYKEGGIAALEKDKVPAALKAALESNAKLMQAAEVSGTPGIFYKDKDKVQFIPGMPKLGQLPAITGISEQKVDDPELARFR